VYEKWLAKALKAGARYADLRHQTNSVHSLEARNGKIERSLSGREQGIGLTVLVKDGWGFYSTNRPTVASLEKGLQEALRMAKAASAHAREPQGVAEAPIVKDKILWKPKRNPADVPVEEKQAVVAEMHKAVKGFKEVKSTSGTYGDRLIEQTFYSSDGSEVETAVTRSVAQVHFIAKAKGRITSRRARLGATKGFELFEEEDVRAIAHEAAKATVRMLMAPAAPSGRMTVITDPELTGVFTHEAVGHASEGDLVAAGESCLADKMGKRIGSELVTVCDDSTVKGAFGSFPFDDHGIESRRRVMVEDGVFKSYLTDRASAFRLKVAPSGSARAESYAVRPLVRMTNTFILPRDLAFDEMIEDVKDGVYAVGSRGGQVDTAKGSFQFSAQEAYRIRNGEVAEPLRDVSLTGFTLETLENIDGVGKVFEWGDPGYCGKGQWVPVGDGGPHLRIRNAIVGGSA
jgi:TldD protein